MLNPNEIQAMKEQDVVDIQSTSARRESQIIIDRHQLLLDREELQAEIERLKELHKHDHVGVTLFSKALFGREDIGWTDSLRELDSLRHDKERLDWLENSDWVGSFLVRMQAGKDLRNAIDAAIARERKGEK